MSRCLPAVPCSLAWRNWWTAPTWRRMPSRWASPRKGHQAPRQQSCPPGRWRAPPAASRSSRRPGSWRLGIRPGARRRARRRGSGVTSPGRPRGRRGARTGSGAWWRRLGSNQRQHDYESCALPLSYAAQEGGQRAARVLALVLRFLARCFACATRFRLFNRGPLREHVDGTGGAGAWNDPDRLYRARRRASQAVRRGRATARPAAPGGWAGVACLATWLSSAGRRPCVGAGDRVPRPSSGRCRRCRRWAGAAAP